jgi:protein-tyrosine phosphatase
MTERRIELDGAVNLRDLGGYPAGRGRRTRWGRVFRSDRLADLSDADRAKVARLGLRTVVDLRLPSERRDFPSRLPQDEALRIVEIGFVPAGTLEMLQLVLAGDIDVAELERRVVGQYRSFPVAHVPEFRRLVRALAAPGALPALVHCTSGKDRTGFAAAVILLIAGVPRDVVLEDYLLTNRYQRPLGYLTGKATPADVASRLTTAQPAYLEAAFAEIDRRWGSDEAFLEDGLGLGEAERAALRDELTEEA